MWKPQKFVGCWGVSPRLPVEPLAKSWVRHWSGPAGMALNCAPSLWNPGHAPVGQCPESQLILVTPLLAGFLGELVRDSYEGVFLIKFHAFDKNIAKKFKFRSVLFIVRNPYDAFIAEYNRENTGGNHLGILNEERFYSAGTILSLVVYQN